MTTNKNNPRLELKLNEEVRLKLKYDKCLEGNSSKGAYYLYGVSKEDGTECSFFAPEDIHTQIVAHKLKAGSEFILKKVQNGKGITGELVFEAIPQNGVKEFPSNGHADNFKAIMQLCLQDAIEITKAVNSIPFQNEDIRAISSCLFIARTKQYG